MAHNTKPVFYSESTKRWKRFLFIIRIIFALFVIAVFAVGFEIFSDSPDLLPKLRDRNQELKKVLNPEKVNIIKTKANTVYKNLRSQLKNVPDFNYLRKFRLTPANVKPALSRIRAGFYVNWDLQSYYSLRDNISKLNMVFCEWLFVPDTGNTVVADIDYRALSVLKKGNAAIVPMLTNFFKGDWNGDNVHRIISSKEARSKFIESILNILRKYGFNGINIDFEELNEKYNENLTDFVRELYKILHSNGYLVTQDISPFNSDYNISELKNYLDYIVIMAYDNHYADSEPGPVAPVKWVEQAITSFMKKVAPEKLILGLAAYGYDWQQGYEGNEVSYQEAMVTAKESEGKIDFNDDNYNLSYTYYDDNDNPHEVWFTDAGTCFNLMRTASDFGTSGVAVWRLGSEDSRIWKFYTRDFSGESFTTQPFNPKRLYVSPPTKDLDYQGEGEIIDIISTPDSGYIQVDYDNNDNLVSEEKYIKFPQTYVIKKFGKAPGKIVLTFDDGPSDKYTPQILDILRREKVPATFFIVGLNAENNLSVLRKINDLGYEIGNHTFSHPRLADESQPMVNFELSATRKLIESITGRSTILFRPPFNADAEPETMDELIPIIEAKKMQYYTVGESIDPRDWEENIPADSIFNRIVREEKLGSIILLHDAGGDRSETVKALPRIIHYFKEKGYGFTTIAGMLGYNRNFVMPTVEEGKEKYFSEFNWWIINAIFWFDKIIFGLFFLGILLAVGRTLFIIILASIQKSKDSKFSPEQLVGNPLVSIVIPAHNEEVTSVKTIQTLLQCDYKNIEIIFVDDGSSDNTYHNAISEFGSNENVKIYTKPNGGKASALNFGIHYSKGKYLICIDADTQLKQNAISKILKYFTGDKVAAVAGNVKVGNKHNLLTKWQSIEYITSQNFDRRAFDVLNCITVVPGAIGAFRKSAVDEVGGFKTDTLAEDCDLTLQLLQAGYTIRNCMSSIAYTEAPETFKMFLKQRFRWSFGIMQSIWKHRKAMFKPRYKNFGMFALPHAMLFQFIMPLIAPLADFVMLLSIYEGYWVHTLPYYLLFALMDVLSAIIAFRFEKEKIRDIWLLLPQRFIYRQLMYLILYRTVITAIRGTLVGWGVLKRTGRVELAN
ncbi:MAG: glycosyltransferase [Bacteroidetes bacterium]|nr:MAG: glycosyltransferase [Bacteroidota bacterium]